MKSLLFFASLILLCLLPEASAQSAAAREAQAAARELRGAVRNCDMSWIVDRMYPPLVYLYANKLKMSGSGGAKENQKRHFGSIKENAYESQKRIEKSVLELRQKYREIGKQLKNSGIIIEDFRVGEPYAEYVLSHNSGIANSMQRDRTGSVAAEDLDGGKGKSRLIVLPTKLTLSVPNGRGARQRAEQSSYILAIRDEVIDAKYNTRGTVINEWYFVDTNTDTQTLRNYFSNLPLRLKLPATGTKELPSR